MSVQVNLADFSDNHWVTCFQETAEQILGMKADEVGRLKQNVCIQLFSFCFLTEIYDSVIEIYVEI